MSIFSSRPLTLIIGLCTAVFMADRAALALGQGLLLSSGDKFALLYQGLFGPDVVLIGNSRTTHGFDPARLSDRSCRDVVSLGLNGTGMATAVVVARDVADLPDPPRTILIEVSTVFSADWGATALSPFINDSQRLADHLHSTNLIPWRQVFRSSVLNSDLFWKGLLRLGQGTASAGATTVGTSSEQMASFLARWSQGFTVSQTDVGRLKGLIGQLQDKGIEVVLVAAPYHPDVLKLPGGRTWVGALSRQLDHPVVDLTNLTPEDRFFADPLHGNHLGRARVTQALAPALSICEASHAQ